MPVVEKGDNSQYNPAFSQINMIQCNNNKNAFLIIERFQETTRHFTELKKTLKYNQNNT